ncbi:quinoprotein dehydrogenase-associated SoxYZ-like carrier [Roseibium marinum]|uniref:Sulfur-oxidizing protein SoxY n=1 Tax=Roseibium marinum TaxID=281252 RepID=A0A2S3UKG8_9HYPH|nr:quinoprotein dehydrogenase-associated SoxYZ-like carrier [Roseibium marinum]POF27989.1 sulfur-oxidizing protein SoxY [Roseibium marinum]
MSGNPAHRVNWPACLAAAVIAFLLPAPAAAIEANWPDLRSELYGGRFLAVSDEVISIDAPYRTDNDARTGVTVRLAAPEGHAFRELHLILDENPMPVSAQLTFARPLTAFEFAATMRFNGPTPVHAVAVLENGQLFVAETFVKTSGLGACSAPPGTDPDEALATLGQMELVIRPQTDSASLVRNLRAGRPNGLALDVKISHPSHSGMQRDQISLLYIPIRYVDTLDINLNGEPFATMTGSISLSENPQVTVSVPKGTRRVRAKLTDTDGTASEVERELADY